MDKLHLLILTVTVVCLTIALAVHALINQPWRIQSYGTVKAIGVAVYWDSTLTRNVTAIEWGFLEPGQNKTVRVYIQSVSNVPVTLDVTTVNWQPPNASTYIKLSPGPSVATLLNPGDSIPLDLTLSISPNITGIKNFSFDIIIRGTG